MSNTPLNADDELRRDIALLFNRQSNANAKSRSETISDAMDIVLADRKKHELQARIASLRETSHQGHTNLKTAKAVAQWADMRIADIEKEQESYE